MDAFLSDKECWYYMKLLTFTLGIGMEVLHQYFEQKILQSMDFYVFVEKYKHYLFHECFPTVQCCECSQMQLAAQSKRGCLNEIQFQLLFEIARPSKPDHYKTGRNNTIVKDCLCRIDAKRSNEVDCMDITLMCAIINSCLINNNTSIYGNPRFLETIKETRNFLAHSTDLRIAKSEFDTRWAKTEHAVIEIASVVGNYFLKLQKRKIDAFKDNELSMENIKTIIDNNADEVKKNLQTLVADQRKNTILIKDEIIENLTKYKDYLDELSIDIGSLKFEVKQYALAVVASCSAEETFDSQVHQKDAPTRSSEVSVTEKDKDNSRCRVEWRLETPSTWNLLEIKETLEKFSALLRQWFEIEFVYVGSLVIKTLVKKNVLDNQDQMRKSIHSFLEKIVDVCKIKTDVSAVIKVALIIDPGESDYKEEAEKQTSKIEMNKNDKTTCIFCNKSFDCKNCLQQAKIISRLEDEISENRRESSAISMESVVSEMDKDSPEIKSLKSENEAVIICENCKKKDNIISDLKEKIYENKDDTKEAQVAVVEFRELLAEKTCFEGETVSLGCIIEGEKKPCKWYKSDNVVRKLSDNVRDESNDQTYKLTIQHATRENTGVYILLIGNESKDFRLNVIERPSSLIKLRSYQRELAESALKGENTIICAGKNAGKTYVAFHVIESHLLKHPRGKVVFINKTNVLLSQQYERACDTLTTLHFQGKIKIWKDDEDNSEHFETEIAKARLIFLTPKSLCNHLIDTATPKVLINIFSLIIIDECHHTHDKSVYNELMSYYRIAKYREMTHRLPQILGLTTSLDTNKAKDLSAAKYHLRKVMANLDVTQLSVVKRHRVELLQYTFIPEKVTIALITRKLDPVKDILIGAMEYVENQLNSRIVLNFLTENLQIKGDLYEALYNPPNQRADVRYIQWIGETKENVEHVLHKDTKVPRLLHACLRHLEIYAECLEINSLLEIDQVCEIVMQRYANESFASQNANTNEERELISKLRDVVAKIRENGRNTEENPDVNMVIGRIKKEYQLLKEDSRFIIYVKTGVTAKALAERLPVYLRSTYLTGSHRSVEEGGLPFHEQIEVLEKFKNGEHLCIVATSVGCEVLDVPQCNMIIRYRFSADEISSLQMRGRLRNKEGREVIVSTIQEFETEKKNIQSQYLMTQAIDEVSKLNITRDIAIAEKMLYEFEEIERRSANMKLNQKRKGLFTINCKYCGIVITDGDSMRQVNKTLFLVCDRSMLARVEYKPIPKKNKIEFDGFKKLGKVYGLECGHNWGSIIIYKECEFVALSLDYIKIFDRQADSFINCKKWYDLIFKIEEMSDGDFINYSGQVDLMSFQHKI